MPILIIISRHEDLGRKMCLQGQRKTTRDFITTEELTRVDDGFGRAQTAVQ